ncbi:MAG: ABC transporter ATP-binding protein, partial [Patescibacteria group bacterium]|nr:ABC transporter ATP-binding protein [Patescibacteria group bacterium]
MSFPALVIKDLKKTYGSGTVALKGISLEVPEGDFFALLGPNGAGKTTIIGIVTGLVTKTGGTVSVFGYDIDKDTEKAKTQIGLVGQEINFNPFERVLDIVVNQGGYYGIPRSEAIPRAKQLLADLGLGDKMTGQAMQLSGGMKRRLMIARALIHKPRFLILDEPTAGVDVELR